MAQRVQVILVCDVHEDETPGTQTIGFSVDGTAYEIDVCDQHAGELREAFGRYVGLGRRSAGRGGAGGKAGARRRRVRGSGEAAAVRDWARSQGLPVPERGRIPADLAEKYAAQHS